MYYLAVVTGQNILFGIVNALPKSLLTIRSFFKHEDFIEYVVCPKCCKLYLLPHCSVNKNGIIESKLCDNVEFPNHPHSSRRQACGEVLLKKIKVGNKTKLVPRKIYVYRSIIQSLKAMSKRKGFLEKCDRWRSRPKENLMGDIYDA